MTDYLDKMKRIADALEAIAQPVMKYDLCNQILSGWAPSTTLLVLSSQIVKHRFPLKKLLKHKNSSD